MICQKSEVKLIFFSKIQIKFLIRHLERGIACFSQHKCLIKNLMTSLWSFLQLKVCDAVSETPSPNLFRIVNTYLKHFKARFTRFKAELITYYLLEDFNVRSSSARKHTQLRGKKRGHFIICNFTQNSLWIWYHKCLKHRLTLTIHILVLAPFSCAVKHHHLQ